MQNLRGEVNKIDTITASFRSEDFKMSYVDGFVAAVPIENKDAFIEHAQLMAQYLKQYGAKQIVDCWGDDIPPGEVTSFAKAVHCKDGETIVFSWIVWESKQSRDEGMEKIMQDERVHNANTPMPFDGQRVIHGGFQVLLDETA